MVESSSFSNGKRADRTKRQTHSMESGTVRAGQLLAFEDRRNGEETLVV